MDELKDKEVATTPVDKTRTDYVNGIYDSQIAAQKQELENAYNQNVTAQQRANDKIGTTYQTNANQFAVDAERNRRNFNMQAAMNGLNTGAGSQANLVQNASYNNGMQSIRTAQADAVTAGEQAMADIQTQYQNEIAAAIANNDYQRATALYEAWNNDKADKENKAALLANYGDFSGYAELYGQSQASAMEKVWIASNPDLAYKLGKIDANKYYSMTGKWPAGYNAGGGGYYGGGGGDSGSSNALREGIDAMSQVNPSTGKNYTTSEILSVMTPEERSSRSSNGMTYAQQLQALNDYSSKYSHLNI